MDFARILKQFSDVDKDFRITAVTDLTEELRKDSFSMDSSSEAKIVESLLRLLKDSAKEVQDVAVKCLGPLVRKVSEQHVAQIISALSENIALTKRGDQEVREVSNSGLKTVLRDVNDELGERVSALLVPGLVSAIKSDNADVVQECLDVLNDLLTRFGSCTNPAKLQEIEDATLVHLDSSRNLIKQRAIWVLTNVSKHCPEETFTKLSSALIGKMGSGNLKKQSIIIQLVGSIARDVGFRMGKHVNGFVPLLVQAVNKSSDEGDEDIKDNAFQTFSSFVESCPHDIRPHIDTLLDLCLKFIAWDPNQLEDSDEESAGGGSDDDDDEGSGSEDSGMEASEDEDDDTWMVRRAAAKTIRSIIEFHGEHIGTVVTKASAKIVKQFRERESTARHEILGVYEAMAVAVANAGKSKASYAAFVETLPKAVAALAKLLSNKSVETRIASVATLRSLGTNVPGSLGPHLKALVPGISAAVQDSNMVLRISALDLLGLVLKSSPAEVQPLLNDLFAPVKKTLAKSAGLHSKVASAALDACEAFLVAGAGKTDFLIDVYASFEPIYKQTDLDAEAKQAAIRAAARAVCNLGSKLPNLDAALETLVERMGSELTREASATAVGTICESGASVGDTWLAKAVPLLNSFCAPGARSLKMAALSSLGFVFEHFGDVLKSHSDVLKAVTELIDVEDMTLAQLATHVVTVTLHSNPKCVGDVKKTVYPRIQTLLQSPLLEGLALSSVAELYHELAMLETKGFGFSELSKDLTSLFASSESQQQYRNVATCYAQLIVGGDQKAGAKTVASLVKQASSKKEGERLAALYTLGEVGRAKDASEYSGVVEALAAALDAPERNIGLAASYALGSVAVGNLSKYLPYILDDMNKNPARQLLLLQAVKEIVSGQSSGPSGLRLSLSSSMGGTAAQDIAVHLDTLLPILFQHASSEDDLTRNAISECLGRLAKIAPERIVNEVTQAAAKSKPFGRATMVNALRYAVTDRSSPELDELLTTAYGLTAQAIGDEDITVRLAGLQAVTWALQTKPRIVKPHLKTAMPFILKETVKDESLIKVIDLGQIKHVTDHGLDKRTAAYGLLYVMLDKAFDSVSVSDYVQPITSVADDVITIKEAAYKLVRRLAHVAGPQLFGHLDALLPSMEKECKRPIPKSEPQERALVMKRQCLMAIQAINSIPNAAGHSKLQEVINKSIKGGVYKDEWAVLEAAQ